MQNQNVLAVDVYNGNVCGDVSGTVTANAGGGKHCGNKSAYAVDCRNGAINEINGTLQSKPKGGSSCNLNNTVLL